MLREHFARRTTVIFPTRQAGHGVVGSRCAQGSGRHQVEREHDAEVLDGEKVKYESLRADRRRARKKQQLVLLFARSMVIIAGIVGR